MSQYLQLQERLDFDAARDLHASLLALRGADLTIDGSAVRVGGALAAQILLAAARDWSLAGKSLILSASTSLQDDLSRLGLLGAFSLQQESV
jgi:anti-anti-sigma regulatory factor